MGDLIVMSRAQPLAACEFAVGHSAEILFFTGVRYYRMDEAGAGSPTRRRSAERRRAIRRARAEQAREAQA